MNLSDKNKKAILSTLEWVEKDITKIRDTMQRATFDLELLENWSDRIHSILETGQDPHEDCVCGEPYFCHDEEGCSGQPHSSVECDCNLAKFRPASE